MELDLKAFSLSIAVGLFVGGILYFSLATFWPLKIREAAGSALSKLGTGVNAPTVLVAVAALGIGMIAEDLSKNALADKQPSALGPLFRSIMSTEGYHRAKTIVDTADASLHRQDNISFCSNVSEYRSAERATNTEPTQQSHEQASGLPAPPANQETKQEPTTQPAESRIQPKVYFKYTPVGARIIALLDNLHATGQATLAEARTLDLIKMKAQNWPIPKRSNDRNTHAATCREVIDTLEPLYYLAKNLVYQKPTYFGELESIRTRYNFARSVAFTLLCGIQLVIFIYLSIESVRMWRGVGSFKTIFTVITLLALVLAMFDTIWLPAWRPYWLPDFLDSNIDDQSFFLLAWQWTLPALFVWICLYRLRRVWRRVPKAISASHNSNAYSAALLREKYEKQAARALANVVILVALLVPIRLAHDSDQANYITRVIAYYEVIRGSVLACPPSNATSGQECGRSPAKPEQGND